ncbi:class I SAM-dependent methyltransferase [Hoeflea alexandrii]|uniref:class I SAM-dependent methyltransferase n=1 Tax=Hoeflea alexandrii TaxID=288436 RepID=UPI0022AECA21|nr:class I SAM-dependent methyltransferase [Hoeflea alexandrii]MCZ4291021.1 methyltransferase [Hoeflea alexandrii]
MSSRDYWERNIKGFSGFYDTGSEETLRGSWLFRAFYRTFLLPVEKAYMRKRYAMVRSFIDSNSEGGTAADIGCGSGIFSIIMAERQARVYALDFAKSAVELTRENIPANLTERITVDQLDILNDSIPRVDTAIAIGVLPYVADEATFIDHIAPNCDRILFNFLDADNLLNRLRKFMVQLDARGYCYHSKDKIAAQLGHHGFDIEKEEALATGWMITARRQPLKETGLYGK